MATTQHQLGDPCPECSGSMMTDDGLPCTWYSGVQFCEDGHVGEERVPEKKKKRKAMPTAHVQDSDSDLREFASRLGKERKKRELEISSKLAKAIGRANDAEAALTKARSAVESARLALTTASREARSAKEELRTEMQRREHALLLQAKARRRFDLEFAGRIQRERLKSGEEQAQNDVWHRERCAEVEMNYSEILTLVRGLDQ